jgi:hypothetical protein
MIPREMVITSLALGGFVLCAGCYGLLYCIARLRASRTLIYGAYAAYAAQLALALAIVLLSSLGGGWKLLVAVSALAYLPIPPVTWRYLETLHQATEHP